MLAFFTSVKWRKLHNEELHDPYSSPTIVRMIKSRRMRWAGHVARMGRGEVYTGFLWGNLRVREPLARPRRRWEDNIKMDPQEVGCEDIGWSELARVRDRWRALVNAVMNFRVP
jgi:hypothetical protein